jgi:hypothetical protein
LRNVLSDALGNVLSNEIKIMFMMFSHLDGLNVHASKQKIGMWTY